MSQSVAEQPASCILAVASLDVFVKEYSDQLGGVAAKPSAPKPGGNLGIAGPAAPVQFSVQPGEINVTRSASGSTTLTLTMGRGYHINSNKPGPDFLVPLRVELTGCEGLKATIEYPAGERYEGELADEVMFVHHGSVKLQIRVEQTGKVTGRPQLLLQYQACTDKECLAPKTEVLPLRIVFER
jgi:hypothetical protein